MIVEEIKKKLNYDSINISRDYQWGCLTNQKKVYVFGGKFRGLVAQKANELGLKICV